jgi:PhoPQ-activated pathogenicity-related protein
MLSNVPYQPLQFAGDSEPIRAEDGLIAKSYREFLDGGDQNWPALLPMVKSAVRAMDTVQDLALKQRSLVVNEFVVSGASKRGWTTWLTAAVDSRVKAIAPMVINVLNMQEQMEYHRQAYEGVIRSPRLCQSRNIRPMERSAWAGAIANRRSISISKPFDDAKIHDQWHRRPILCS